MKQNAKEYLKEFASTQPNWMRALIYGAIETNGTISTDKQNEIFNSFKNDEALTIKEPNINNDNSDKEIYITELKHIRGVGALKENQAIKFSNNITILYGLNGAGKSSYFKILNEIVGGNQKKEILSNIYSENNSSIAVDVSFEEKEHKKIISWDGTERSLDLLNKCKVFDSSYLNGLLNIREPDTTLIEPLGLNLFSYLVSIVDGFKEKLKIEINKKKLEKPTLDTVYFRNEIKQLFESHNMTEQTKKQIENLFKFSHEKNQELKNVKENLQNLKQRNIQDTVTLKKNKKSNIDGIKTNLVNSRNELITLFEDSNRALEHLKLIKEKNKLAKEQFKILATLPNNDKAEWKQFIQSGEKYHQQINDSDHVCIYCRQPLQSDDSIKLIKAYGEFLRDESEQELKRAIKKIDDLKEKVNDITIETNIQKNYTQYIDETLMADIKTINSELSSSKETLLKKLNEQNLNINFNFLDIANISTKLDLISNSIQEEIKKLSDDDEKKLIEIDKLGKKLKELQENESISNQQDTIKKWFQIDHEEKRLTNKLSKINTSKITTESKKAHESLLTNALVEQFKKELSSLGYNDLEIKIEPARGTKGVLSTKLTLFKDNDFQLILSEGEQKAVALAVFIAETKIQKTKNPIILDDPINSLDHQIATKFAQILLELDNQIILFNHNKLFLDAFETSKTNHICKEYNKDGTPIKCKKEGKHTKIYEISSEGYDKKGVLIEYELNKAKFHIKQARSLLDESPFKEQINVANLLRRAVECTIDEVILNNQIPTKYSNKKAIEWHKFKHLNNDNSVIDNLKKIYGRVSGGAIHNGTESEENPITVDEFKGMITELNKILDSKTC